MSQQTMSPKAKKVFLIILGVIVISGVILYSVLSRFIDARMQERTELMAGLPESITKMFDYNQEEFQPVVAEEFSDKVHFTKYLFFNYQPMRIGDNDFSHSYDKSINEKLGTDAFYGHEDLDGIVYADLGMETIGYYYNDGIFSKKDHSEPSDKSAVQLYRVLNYVTFPDGVIIHQDTIWGEEPPSSIKTTDSGIGKDVSEKDIVAAIKSTIN